MAEELESAKAIDGVLADDLRAVGIHDLRELRAVGAAEAWERLFAADLRDTLASRLALEAAVVGRRPAFLDPETRERCAAHVRRRVAGEPVAAGRSSGFRVAPPRSTPTRGERRDARLVRVVLWTTVIVVAVLLVLSATLD